MSLEPPPFQESSRCDICNCSFNTFRRRILYNFTLMLTYLHVAIPFSFCSIIADVVAELCVPNIHQIKWLYHNLVFTHLLEFAQIVIMMHLETLECSMLPCVYFLADCLLLSIRVDDFLAIGGKNMRKMGTGQECLPVETLGFLNSGKSDGAASVNGVNSVTDSVSRVDINTPSNSDARQSAGVSTPDCKCGMPLCICEVPSNDNVAPVQPKPMPTSTVSTMSKTKKADTAPRSRGSSSYSKSSTGQSANAQKPLADYEVNGEVWYLKVHMKDIKS
ncbi:hypothetical protein Ccrd_005965 [Cynara cardunculus var. scolymus]|uniref:Uncharacterized protein n=1 Tax=Cynara cardunculus var. scolymus TaxID=59895 RepID=A0A118JUT6_CYNCS|nr:hypothetical protein Ccrd_005965 [Cynara cardunculus var. scolymus]